MRVVLDRLRRDDGGQALAEYGIAVALIAGVDRFGQLASDMLGGVSSRMLVGAALGIVVLYVFSSRGRRVH